MNQRPRDDRNAYGGFSFEVGCLIAFFVVVGGVGFWLARGPSGLPMLQAIIVGILAPFVLLLALAAVAFVDEAIDFALEKLPIITRRPAIIIAILSAPAATAALIQLQQAGVPLAPTAFLVIVAVLYVGQWSSEFAWRERALRSCPTKGV